MIETWAIDFFGPHLAGLFFTAAMAWFVIFSCFLIYAMVRFWVKE